MSYSDEKKYIKSVFLINIMLISKCLQLSCILTGTESKMRELSKRCDDISKQAWRVIRNVYNRY